MLEILVLYYSRYGAVAAMANQIARGIESVDNMQARLRTVPPVSPTNEASSKPIPESGHPYVNKQDLTDCAGIALGSPTRFGNMAAPLKYFLDTTGAEWMSGVMIGKPASVFSSTASLHGGQESTLISMMFPLIHHGALIVGLPYSEADLTTTTTGGTPYGSTHVTFGDAEKGLSDEEKRLCIVQGKRLATIARQLANSTQ